MEANPFEPLTEVFPTPVGVNRIYRLAMELINNVFPTPVGVNRVGGLIRSTGKWFSPHPWG